LQSKKILRGEDDFEDSVWGMFAAWFDGRGSGAGELF
jgi:hypothetical protein